MALKALGRSTIRAAPGKFRACTLIDSEPYQIDEDASTGADAMKLVLAAQKSPDDLFQIFDDQGLPCIKDGTLAIRGEGR